MIQQVVSYPFVMELPPLAYIFLIPLNICNGGKLDAIIKRYLTVLLLHIPVIIMRNFPKFSKCFRYNEEADLNKYKLSSRLANLHNPPTPQSEVVSGTCERNERIR